MTHPATDNSAFVVDPDNPVASIESMAHRCSNWGRWGDDDVHGTLNFIDDDARVRAARLVTTGQTFSLAQSFDAEGPQNGWRRRTNPVHTMTDTGLDAEHGNQGFPFGFGGADDVIAMPLQCSTQWDGLGHIFDHGRAWNGRPAGSVVTSEGDQLTGIETAADRIAGRAVLLDAGRVLADELALEHPELPDGFALTPDRLDRIIDRQGVSAQVGRGDILLVRTGQYSRVRREGWGDYAGGAAPGLSFHSAPWLHDRQIAAIATDTWGFEVRPTELNGAFQPLHQIVIPHMGLYIGEMWNLDGLAEHCSRTGRYEAFLVAAPLPVTGAVGSPVNPLAVV
jgi:kynurenine formamidase